MTEISVALVQVVPRPAKAEALELFVERQPTTLARLRSDMLSSASGELDGLLRTSAKQLFQQKYRLAGPTKDNPAERTSLLDSGYPGSCETVERL